MGHHLEVTGTVIGPATLRTPLTDQPCVAWLIKLEYGQVHGAGEQPTYRTVWQAQRVADLTIEYDWVANRALLSIPDPGTLQRGNTEAKVSLRGKVPPGW